MPKVTGVESIMTTQTIIGVDVSKACLDCWGHPTGRAGRVDYDTTTATLPLLVKELTELPPARLIVEATGGLEVKSRWRRS